MGDPAYKQLSRRKVRYWCFRFKTETGTATEAPGAKATGSPAGLRAYFEKHEHFLGWDLFSESRGWDVDEVDPFKIVPLKVGSTEAWQREIATLAIEFPG